MRTAFGLTSSFIAVAVLGCGNSRQEDSGLAVAVQALTTAQSRILGFESPAADWSATNGATLTAASNASQGTSAAAVTPNSYVQLASAAMPAIQNARALASFDLMLPTSVGWGEARLIVEAPSAGVYWQDLGGQPLVGYPAGVYHTLSFPVPESVRSALASASADVVYRIVLNVPWGSGQYLVDNLVVADDGPSGTPGESGLTVYTLPGTSIADTFISASNRLYAETFSTLGQEGALEPIASLGGAGLFFGANVEAHANVSDGGFATTLMSNAHIYGLLRMAGTFSEETQEPIHLDFGYVSGASVSPVPNSWAVTWPSGAGTQITAWADAAPQDLPPGHYADTHIYSRATVTLHSGVYYFDKFYTEPEAHIRVDGSGGPVFIYVNQELHLNASLEEIGGQHGQVLFGYLGVTPAIFQEAIAGTVVAPQATIELRRPQVGIHEGAFFGKDVFVYSGAVVHHLPFDFGFICPSGDYDGDGIYDCSDACWNDPNKTEPGICSCGTPETDTDGDLVPDCIDECPKDPANTYKGQCGCGGDPDVAPAGTPCNDGIAAGDFVCNGAGTCGNPADDAPQSDCWVRTLGTHSYWICPSGGTGTDQTSAVSLCDESAGRRLLQIDNPQENAFAAALIPGPAWIGGTDRTTEGEWFWMDAAMADGDQFWTGGGPGRRHKGRYAQWANQTPGDGGEADCSTLSKDGLWRAAPCNESHYYVCEGVFGPPRDVGPGPAEHDPEGGNTIIPGYQEPGAAPPCVPLPDDYDQWLAESQAHLDACNEYCGADVPEADRASESDCENIHCAGEAAPPPAGSASPCSPIARPLAPLDVILPGTCSAGEPGDSDADIAAAQDCSAVSPPDLPMRCGVQTQCLYVDSANDWATIDCTSSDDCISGQYCHAELGKCVDPWFTSNCQDDEYAELLDDEGVCHGQCFTVVGCGFDWMDLGSGFGGAEPGDGRCSEVTYCGEPPYEAGLLEPEKLENEPFPVEALPDASEAPEPEYSNDFETPCTDPILCNLCIADPDDADAVADCDREMRHDWCTNDTEAPGVGYAAIADTREGERGDDTTMVSFKIDPIADLRFHLQPLPYGAAKFDLMAAAAVRATAKFDLEFATGEVELVDLRGEITASLCRASTMNSRMEVLGIDFLPRLDGASSFLFDTNERGLSEADCKAAVSDYLDAFDRAKKAMRDAQELIQQYKVLEAQGRTFAAGFCEQVAGDGMRPPGMTGSCSDEDARETVNSFIGYYDYSVSRLRDAIASLKDKALDSDSLEQALGHENGMGFDVHAPLVNVGDEQSTTIAKVLFFVGPIPAMLEVMSYMNYGIDGGFGASLHPERLLNEGGRFASAGVVITPYADAGITLFVGAGFNIGPLKLQAGVEGGITLANIDLPATVTAGLTMLPEADDRALPEDLAEVSDGGALLFPFGGVGQQKYGYHFDLQYGADLILSNMLSGWLKGTVKVKFFFFSKKWSQMLAEFDGFTPDPSRFHLMGGGVEVPTAESQILWKNSYSTVPLAKLERLLAPQAPLTADGTFDPSRVVELYYDSLCACVETGEVCQRNDDCCEDVGCGGDDGPDGKPTCGGRDCSEEGQPCVTEEDCCPREESEIQCLPSSGSSGSVCHYIWVG